MTNTKGTLYDIEARVERYLFLKEKKETAANYCIESLCWNILFITAQPHSFFENNTLFKTRDDSIKFFKKLAPDFFKCKRISLFKKILLFMFYMFPYSYFLYRHFSPIHLRKD